MNDTLHHRGRAVELRGYAAVYGVLSDLENSGAREVISPGAFGFADTAGMSFNVDHDLDRELSGRLQLAESPIGLMFRLTEIQRTAEAETIIEGVRAGRLSGCSFAADAHAAWVKHDGETARLLTAIPRIEDLCVTATPLFQRAGCWTNDQTALPPPLSVLRDEWMSAALDGVSWRTVHLRPRTPTPEAQGASA